jgi:RNA polymerase sigma-70 factor (ECF subfamily)
MTCEMAADTPPIEDGVEPVPTDQSLLRRFRAGEDTAATELYSRYADRLYRLASARVSSGLQQRVDADDIVQSVFRTFFRRAALGQYAVPDGEELWKLFLVIGLNKIREIAAHHHAGKRSLKRTAAGDAVEQAGVENDDVAELALRMAIDEVLAPLPDVYREIVRLRIDRHEVADIAVRVGRSKRSVERILHEFQQKLHGLIDGK